MNLPAVHCVDCGRSLTDELSRRCRRGRVCRERAGIVVVTVRASGPREQRQPAPRRRGDVPGQLVLDLTQDPDGPEEVAS